MAALAVVRDLREHWAPASAEELERFETDALSGFVLARASAGLADGTIRGDVGHLDQIRTWFGRPLWDMEPADADAYFGKVLRNSPSGTRLARSQALTTYFMFLELRHKGELHRMTGRAVECPIDEMNRPRGAKDAQLRIPPSEPEVATLFTAWGDELATCRKFTPTARNYTAAKLMSQVGLRVSEACKLDLDDIKWNLGRFGKLHVRHGKGARGSGPRERMVPLINGADRTLRWFIEDVWGQFDDDHTRPGAPLFPSERKNTDGTARRVGDDALRKGLKDAAAAHLPGCACPAAFLRVPALWKWAGLACNPGGFGTFLDRYHDAIRPRPADPGRGRLGRRDRTGREAAGRADPMRWNLRLTAANEGIWKASELQRSLAEHGLVISAGKMSGLWSGQPISLKLEDLDVICVVLGCEIGDLLIPEPDKVRRPGEEAGQQAAAVSAPAPAVVPRRRDGRSLPPQ